MSQNSGYGTVDGDIECHNLGGAHEVLKVALKSCSQEFLAELPNVLRGLFGDYRRLISDLPVDDVKRFTSCQLAGRSALLHVQELLRVADRLLTLSGEPRSSSSDVDLGDLLRQAREAIGDLEASEDF